MKSPYKVSIKSGALFGVGADFFFISNGFWLVGLLFLSKYFLSSEGLTVFWAVMALLLGMPHTIAPLYLFVRSDFNKSVKASVVKSSTRFLRLWFFFLFLSYLMALLLQLHYKTSFGEIFILISCIHIFWNYFHFGRQHFGVLHMYNLKSQRLDAKARNVENFFCLFSVTLSLLNVFYYLTPKNNKILAQLNLGITFQSSWVAEIMPTALILLALIGSHIIFRSRWSIMKCVYIFMVLLQPVLGFFFFQRYHFIFFNISHWLTEIFLVSYFVENTAKPAKASWMRPGCKTALILMTLGAGISLGLLKLGQYLGYLNFHTLPVPTELLTSLDQMGPHLIYLVVFSWLATMHFYMDRVVFSSSSYNEKSFLKKVFN